MTDTKHTPGPWVLTQEETWPFSLSVGPNILHMTRIAYGTSNKSLDDVRQAMAFPYAERDDVIAMVATQEANAHLIAAAPDLLEALDRMIAEYDLWGGYNDDGFKSGTILSARAAIAKAKGQTE